MVNLIKIIINTILITVQYCYCTENSAYAHGQQQQSIFVFLEFVNCLSHFRQKMKLHTKYKKWKKNEWSKSDMIVIFDISDCKTRPDI